MPSPVDELCQSGVPPVPTRALPACSRSSLCVRRPVFPPLTRVKMCLMFVSNVFLMCVSNVF